MQHSAPLPEDHRNRPRAALDEGLRRADHRRGRAVRQQRRLQQILGHFEFLVDVSGRASGQPFVFIEANARLQVEHTVTEAVTGVDLVQTQIRLAQGATPWLNWAWIRRGDRAAARLRDPGSRQHGNHRRGWFAAPGGGTLTVYEAPSGPGVRTDGFGYAGYRTSAAFDSLLAKVIVHSPSPDFAAAVGRAARALSEFRLEGVGTNIPFLRNILAHPDFAAATCIRVGSTSTSPCWRPACRDRQRFVDRARPAASEGGFAGARVKSRDPLALFAHDAQVKAEQRRPLRRTRAGTDRAGWLGRGCLADPGHHRRHRCRGRRCGAQGPAPSPSSRR